MTSASQPSLAPLTSEGADPGSAAPRARVLFLNRSYWPDAEATGQLLTELCEDNAPYLDIVVVAGQPNQNPKGASFRRFGSEQRRGVEMRRVPHTRFSKNSFLGRVTNMVTYLVMSGVVALFVKRPDVVVVETDPPILCLLGALLRWWHGAKLVIYLQDIYPDVAIGLGKLPDAAWTRALRRLFFWTYRRAERVVVLSEDMRTLLLAGGLEPQRVIRVPNWADTRAIYPLKDGNPFRARQSLTDRFVVMYSGNMGLSQRLETLLECAALLRDEPRVAFLLVGDGASRPRLEELARQGDLTQVRFLDYQAKELLHESLSAADLQVVVLDPKIAQCLMPSKVYGIMASGTAMLVAAPEGSELATVARAERLGLVVPFDDPAAWAEAIRWSLEHPEELEAMGNRSRELSLEEYDRSRATSRFGRMLAELVGRPWLVPVSAASDLPTAEPREPATRGAE